MSLSDQPRGSSLAWKGKWKLANGSYFLQGKIRAPKHGTQGCLGLDAWVLSHLSHVRLFETLWTLPGSSVRGILQEFSKNTGVDCHALLQGIFPTQRRNSHLLQLLHCKQILYHWANGEAPDDWILTLKFFFLNSAFFRVKGLLLIPLPFLLYLNHPGYGFLLWWTLNLYLPILQGHHLLEAYQDLPFCSANAEPNGILCIFTSWHLFCWTAIFLCVCHHTNMWAPPNRSFFILWSVISLW